jgi:hypothetical protein
VMLEHPAVHRHFKDESAGGSEVKDFPMSF